jgi:hypothetical protein
MIKKSIHVWAVLLLAFAVVFSACEGPAGPAGPGGGEGWKDPGVTYASDVTAHDLAIAFALSATVTVNAPSAPVNLTGVVPSGKTLRISGPGGVLINTGDLTLKNGGRLEVLAGGALIADTSKTLVVEPTATVIVKSGAAYYTAVANAADAVAAKGYTVADAVFYVGSISTFNASTSIPAEKALTVKGSITAFNATTETIAGNLYVTGNVGQHASGTVLTVTGSLTIGGTYTAITAVANNLQYITGDGAITIGTLTVASTSGTATGFKIDGSSVTATNVNITGYNSGTATLTIDGGALRVNGILTLTKATDHGILAGDNAGTVTFAANSQIVEVGGPTQATSTPGLTYTAPYTFAAERTLTWGSDWGTVDLDA